MKLKKVYAQKILNSAGNWTVECTIVNQKDHEITASVPQGISTGDEEKKPISAEFAVEQINKQIERKIWGGVSWNKRICRL